VASADGGTTPPRRLRQIVVERNQPGWGRAVAGSSPASLISNIGCPEAADGEEAEEGIGRGEVRDVKAPHKERAGTVPTRWKSSDSACGEREAPPGERLVRLLARQGWSLVPPEGDDIPIFGMLRDLRHRTRCA
jgi:hypothetical protein